MTLKEYLTKHCYNLRSVGRSCGISEFVWYRGLREDGPWKKEHAEAIAEFLGEQVVPYEVKVKEAQHAYKFTFKEEK